MTPSVPPVVCGCQIRTTTVVVVAASVLCSGKSTNLLVVFCAITDTGSALYPNTYLETRIYIQEDSHCAPQTQRSDVRSTKDFIYIVYMVQYVLYRIYGNII
jgi:hypothetical protein